MTLPEFTNVFAVLAVQLRQTDADEPTIRGYFESLKDLELELISAAAEQLARASLWFPKTSEWRAAVEKIRTERIEQQRAWLRTAPRPLCATCDDTGWEALAIVEHGQPVRRVAPCRCRAERRAELMGQVPMPRLLSPEPTRSVDVDAIVHRAVKGL
jgi:hypothetical protein